MRKRRKKACGPWNLPKHEVEGSGAHRRGCAKEGALSTGACHRHPDLECADVGTATEAWPLTIFSQDRVCPGLRRGWEA